MGLGVLTADLATSLLIGLGSPTGMSGKRLTIVPSVWNYFENAR